MKPDTKPGMKPGAALASRAWTGLKSWVASLGIGSRSRPDGLSVLAKLELGAKKSLWVVAYGERRYLLAGGTETVSAMLELRAGREQRTVVPWRARSTGAARLGRAGGTGTRRTRGGGEQARPGPELAGREAVEGECRRGSR